MILITGNNSPTFLSEKCSSATPRAKGPRITSGCVPLHVYYSRLLFKPHRNQPSLSECFPAVVFLIFVYWKEKPSHQRLFLTRSFRQQSVVNISTKRVFFYALRLRWGQGDRGEVWMELHSFIFILKNRRFHHRFTLLINTWLLIQVRKNRATKRS